MAGRVAGKVAIVTGSTGGIGESIALTLAAEGAKVVVSGRGVERGEAVVDQIRENGGEAFFVRADMSTVEDPVALVEAAQRHYGRVDVLVNNAGIFPDVDWMTMDMDLWDRVYNTNVRGTFLACRAVIPLMKDQGGGSIVNVGTTHVHAGFLGQIAYGSSKGAMYTMNRIFARNLREFDIRVNWITVGWVKTPGEVRTRDVSHGDGEKYLAENADKMQPAQHIADAALFLASDESAGVTGTDLNASKGLWV